MMEIPGEDSAAIWTRLCVEFAPRGFGGVRILFGYGPENQ